MDAEYVVTVYGVDSEETQGYADIFQQFFFDHYPSSDEVIMELDKLYGRVLSYDATEPHLS